MSKFIFSEETETALIEDLVDALKRRGFDAKLRLGQYGKTKTFLTFREDLDAYDVKLILDMIDDMVDIDLVDTIIINR